MHLWVPLERVETSLHFVGGAGETLAGIVNCQFLGIPGLESAQASDLLLYTTMYVWACSGQGLVR